MKYEYRVLTRNDGNTRELEDRMNQLSEKGFRLTKTAQDDHRAYFVFERELNKKEVL